jgi:hypothetical protein
LKTKELQKSHLIPAAALRMLRASDGLPPGPVAMTANVTMTGVRDLKAPLLCRDCEQRFNRNGEHWVLKKMCKGDAFPLLERLRVAVPISQDQSRIVFSGPAVGIPMQKLAYFAVSMLWRSVAYPWKGHDGSLYPTPDIGALQESCRKYLIGQGRFPADLYIHVVVCSDVISQHSAHPLAEMEVPFTAYSFLICGIFFALLLGKDVPQHERNTCCITSPAQAVCVENRSGQAMRVIQRLYKTTRLTKALKDGMPGV